MGKLLPSSIADTQSYRPSGTGRSVDMPPGTSCQATISRSLRDDTSFVTVTRHFVPGYFR